MNNKECSLWMGDLELWMDESFIMNAFFECGFKPNNIKIIKNKVLNKLRNFCFVNFENFQDAYDAILKLNARRIPQTNAYFKLNLTSNNKKTTKNAYVGNLPPTMNDMDLYNMFKSKYPSVYYASIITDKGISRGYGFVHFSKEEEYKKCLEEMDVIIKDDRIIRVKEKKNNNNSFLNQNNYINESSFIDNKFNSSRNEKVQEKDSSSSDSIKNKIFSDNIELLESDDNKELYKKMQESADKIVEHYKTVNKSNEISKMILYYSSMRII